MHVARHLGLVGLFLFTLLTLLGCGAPVPPSPTTLPNAPTTEPTSVPATGVPATPAPVLVINLITPTPFPTAIATTPTLLAPTAAIQTPGAVNPGATVATTPATSGNAAPTRTNPGATTPQVVVAPANTPAPRPNEIGNTAADAALLSILQRCWNLTDFRKLNGNDPAHRAAFDCARQSLLDMVKAYPTYAFVHRVLAWGYLYKDNDQNKAIAEYRTAVSLYQQQGNRVGESEARMRLGLLLMTTSIAQGCTELAQASTLDPTNDRAATYYQSFACNRTASQSGGNKPPMQPTVVRPPSGNNPGNVSPAGSNPGNVPPNQNNNLPPGQRTPLAPPTPVVANVTLDQVRGKILFKSDREGDVGVYVMDADGRNVRRVPPSLHAAAMKYESWSPDRTQVASVRYAGFTQKFGYNNDIWVTDPEGGNGRGLTNPANDFDPAWSPRGLFDGKTRIAFISNRGDANHPDNQGEDVWMMMEDGSNPLRLTCHGPYLTKHPSWSPDANQLIFFSQWPNGNSQVYVLGMSPFQVGTTTCQFSENLVNLSKNAFNDTDPVWVK